MLVSVLAAAAVIALVIGVPVVVLLRDVRAGRRDPGLAPDPDRAPDPGRTDDGQAG